MLRFSVAVTRLESIRDENVGGQSQEAMLRWSGPAQRREEWLP